MSDFILEKIEHKEEHAVSIAYQFYRMSKEKLFSMIGFCSIIEKEAGEGTVKNEGSEKEVLSRIDLKKQLSEKDYFEKDGSLYDELNEISSDVQKKETEEKIYYIIHLINPPEEYCLTPETLPESLINTEIKYKGEEEPYIYVLSPDFGEENFVKAQGHTEKAIIPEIKIWSVVVFEVNKK